MGLNQARNNNDLEKMLMPALEKAVNYVAQKIWEDNKEIVEEIVYDSYQPEEYERTGQFKEAWDTETKRLGNFAQSKFMYDSKELVVNYDKWQHGSKYLREPMTTYLAEIIYQGLVGPMFGEGTWTKKRNAWKALNSKIGIKKIKQYFEEGMRQNGLNFKRRIASIKVIEYDEK